MDSNEVINEDIVHVIPTVLNSHRNGKNVYEEEVHLSSITSSTKKKKKLVVVKKKTKIMVKKKNIVKKKKKPKNSKFVKYVKRKKYAPNVS